MDDHDDYTTEATPLVLDYDGAEDLAPPPYPKNTPIASVHAVQTPTARKTIRTIALLCGIVFIATSSSGFFGLPMTRVFEDVICHKHLGRMQSLDEPIDEQLCKTDAIQSELAYLIAVLSALEAIISCVAAMPWGVAADRIGRKPVLAFALMGTAMGSVIILTVAWFRLPMQLIWLSPVTMFFGGGNAVMTALLVSMTTDLVPEPERAINLMRVNTAAMLGQLLSPAMASALMPSWGPYTLMLIAICLVLLAAAAFQIIPETLKHRAANTSEPGPTTIQGRIRQSLAELQSSFRVLKSPSLILLLATCFSYYPIMVGTIQFVAQFASKRYHIRLADTGYLQSTYGIAQCVVVLVLMPFVSHFVMRPNLPRFLRMADENQRDLVLTRWCYALMILGFCILSFSPSLPLFVLGLMVLALGSGSASLIRSSMALYVDPEHRSRVYSVASIIEILGNVAAMPSLAALWSVGMRAGGVWVGLPYLGLAILSVVVLGLLLCVRIPKGAMLAVALDTEAGNEHED